MQREAERNIHSYFVVSYIGSLSSLFQPVQSAQGPIRVYISPIELMYVCRWADMGGGGGVSGG